jgi:hypothetical protein
MKKSNLTHYIFFTIICLLSTQVYATEVNLKSDETRASEILMDFMTDVDASFATDHKVYVFKGDQYIRCDKQSGYMDFGYPKKISDGWPNLFTNIDAAIYRKGVVYLFKGDQYVRWSMNKSNMDAGYPKKIKDHWKGLDITSIDAAFNWDNERIYFFKGDQYYRYSWDDDKVLSSYPRKIKDYWPGLFHSDIDAVVAYSRYGYFFKGSQYSRYNKNKDKVDDNYPRGFSAGWDFTPQKQPKTLFIYFNGTDRSIKGQLGEFANRINADVQIYVKGVGASMDEGDLYNYSTTKHGSDIRALSTIDRFSTWSKDVIDELSWNPKSWAELIITPVIRKNDYYCNINIFERKAGQYSRRNGHDDISKSTIYGLNKRYVGNSISGYSSRDSEMAAKDVLKLLEYLNYDQIAPFEQIVITGHSRGAAVGIPSLLYAIKKANENDGKFKDYKNIVQKVFGRAKQINVVALDPVAGQTSNTYHMGGNWNTDKIYSYMNSNYNITFNEVYANYAPMEVGIKVANFNPARKYLHQPNNIAVNRYWLGFRHSAMVTLNERGYRVYDKANTDKASLIMSDFLNEAINNQQSFRNQTKWRTIFKDNDQAWYSAIKDDFTLQTIFTGEPFPNLYLLKARHKSYENNSEKMIDLAKLIGSNGIF